MISCSVRAFFVSLGIISILACTTSPTGRKQLKLFGEQQLSQMGSQAFDQMKENQTISDEVADNRYVRCITDHLVQHVPDEVYSGKWEVVVFEDDQINAFALPGGKIGVYTGLMKVAKNQHQLAAVIGHEIGHVIAEHGNERMSNSALIGMGLEATQRALETNEVANNQMLMAALGLSLQVGVQLPFSRTHESEADLIGLDLMAKAGFKPEESVDLWRNMDAASGGNRQPEFLSTHPLPSTRIEDLQANMNAAKALYKRSSQRPDCRQ